MSNINIKATLGICPRTRLHEKLVVQRGASAEIVYSLLERGVSFSLLEQVTFSFKQRKEVFWFNMFRYLTPTEDTEIDDDKVYYKNVIPVAEGSLQCIAEEVTNPVDNPTYAGYYEEVLKLADGQNDLRYFIDPHFNSGVGLNGEFVSFVMAPEETAKLVPTSRGADIQFEVALRLNTDTQEEFYNHDSVIIDPQPGIIVVDSLYSQIDGLVVSESPETLASTSRVVRK